MPAIPGILLISCCAPNGMARHNARQKRISSPDWVRDDDPSRNLQEDQRRRTNARSGGEKSVSRGSTTELCETTLLDPGSNGSANTTGTLFAIAVAWCDC